MLRDSDHGLFLLKVDSGEVCLYRQTWTGLTLGPTHQHRGKESNWPLQALLPSSIPPLLRSSHPPLNPASPHFLFRNTRSKSPKPNVK